MPLGSAVRPFRSAGGMSQSKLGSTSCGGEAWFQAKDVAAAVLCPMNRYSVLADPATAR